MCGVTNGHGWASVYSITKTRACSKQAQCNSFACTELLEGVGAGGYMKGAYITYNNSLRLVQCWRHFARAWAPVLPIVFSIRLYVNSNNYIIVPDLENYVVTTCTCMCRLFNDEHNNVRTVVLKPITSPQVLHMINTHSNICRLEQCWRPSARAWAPASPMLLCLRLYMNDKH